MESIVKYAQELHKINGGPNYEELCKQALRLAKKRKRDRRNNGNAIVSRCRLLIAPSQYTVVRPSGTQQIKKFVDMLSQVDVLYKKRSIGQREFHEAFT